MKKIINTKKAPKAIGPYNQAVLIKDILYCSGQIGINPKTNQLINNNIEEETKQVLENIMAILDTEKMTVSNVVKSSIFITDMSQYTKINSIYSKYFTNDSPARETIEVSKLPKDANIEISIIAVKD